MSITRDLPSDHQHEVLELVDARGDGTIRRFADTYLPTLQAMARRHWVTLHTAMIRDGDQYVTHIVSAGLTIDGLTALVRSRQHRAQQARDTATHRQGTVARLDDPFDATPTPDDLPF